jgi:hypothetical protein
VLKILKWLAIGFIGLIVIVATFGESKKKETTVASGVAAQVSTKQTGQAKPYTLIEASSPKKTRKNSFMIYSPEALSRIDRAATAKQAALDLKEEYRAVVVSVFIEATAESAGRGINFARLTYFSDGCGFAGQTCDGKKWSISASDTVFTEEQFLILREWVKNKDRFLNKDGDLNEEKLTTFLSKKLKIKEDNITLPSPMDFEQVNF